MPFNVVDDCTRLCVAIEADLPISGDRVGRVLDRAAARHGWPEVIVMDNGPEFASKALDQWAYERGIHLYFIQPGKPVQNAFAESTALCADSLLRNTNAVHLIMLAVQGVEAGPALPADRVARCRRGGEPVRVKTS